MAFVDIYNIKICNTTFYRFGGNGCKGTWPSHAYDYVQNRGLPALDEYPPYKEKVKDC